MSARLVTVSLLLLASAARADDEGTLRERSHKLYGNTSFRLVGLGQYQAGTNPGHPGTGSYSRFGFGFAFEGGYLGLYTQLGTLQGIEFRATFGYSLAERYAEPPETPGAGGLLLRPEAAWIFCPRFLRFNEWRVLALAGLGLELDGARWSDTWRAFATLGVRLQVFLSDEDSLSLGWRWMPGTANGALLLRTHGAELVVALGQVHLGARAQLDLAGTATGPGLAWQLGLLGGYAF
ncbi:MAG: hypothetical protein ABTQ32_10365 [Myxococcaceae bacterium]